ncbi:MAG: MASE3 domain-containing protein, partial [Nitrososphaera sp.]
MQIDNDEKRKRADSSSARESTQTLMRSFLHSVHFRYIVIPSIVLSAITFASTLSPNSWVVSDADHFYFEIFAVILSTIVAFYCITRAYTLNEKFSLFIGIGFSTIAVIDFLHAVFSYGAAGDNEFLTYFIPQTWFAGRTFLGAMLVIAVAKYAPKVGQQEDGQQMEEGGEEEPHGINRLHVKRGQRKLDRTLLLSVFVLAFLAISVVAISFFTIFPGIVIPYSLA